MPSVLRPTDRLLPMLVAAIAAVTPTSAFAQGVQRYDIAAQGLPAALKAFAAASGREVVAPSDVIAELQSSEVRGTLAPEQALAQLLRRSGLRAEIVDGAFVIRPIGGAAAETLASDIVVTGTRIRGGAPVGSPVVVIDRAAIDASGRGSVAEILEAIPQNFGGGANEATATLTLRSNANFNNIAGASVNLRGLGSTATLVLLDGVRPPLGGTGGSFSDVSLIPSTAIERIEVLTDGASAIYGSDAIAGVVNFRLRGRFKGFESRARLATPDGDYTDIRLSQLAGFGWAGGGLTLAVEFNQRGRLPGASRAYATEDLRPFGGADLRSLFSNPGTIIAANNAIFGIPAGQDGTRLTTAQLVPGRQNRSDQQRLYDLLGTQKRVSVYAALEQDIGGGAMLFARALAAGRDANRRARQFGPRLITVPVTNAFYIDPIGTRQPLRVQYDFSRDFGAEQYDAEIRSLSVTGGVRGKLGEWAYEASGLYGLQSSDTRYGNFVNTARLATALADPNRATAFNPFGDGSFTNPATLATIRGSAVSRSRAHSWAVGVRGDGPLLALPAGNLRLAIGGEHREENFDNYILSDRGATVTRTQLAGNPGQRQVDAAYAELLVPVFAADTGFPGTLDLSVAGRIERYSDVGTTANPKVGVRWLPGAGLTLRASFGTSFRAPLFEERGGTSQNLYVPIFVPDPQSPTGQTAVLLLRGNAPEIGPERATSLTAGFDWSPPASPGLRVSTTYFRIDYRDRIGTANLDQQNFLLRRDVYAPLITDNPSANIIATYYADPLFQNPFGIQPSAIKAILNAYVLNLGRTTLDGIDVEVRYRTPLAGGTLTLGLDATRFFRISQRITSTAAPDSILGTLGNPVELRGRINAGFTSAGGLSTTASLNYTGPYRNQLVAPASPVAAYTTIDLQLAKSFGLQGKRSLRLALSATNLLDRDPPIVLANNTLSVLAFDPEKASPVGRLISLEATIRW